MFLGVKKSHFLKKLSQFPSKWIDSNHITKTEFLQYGKNENLYDFRNEKSVLSKKESSQLLSPGVRKYGYPSSFFFVIKNLLGFFVKTILKKYFLLRPVYFCDTKSTKISLIPRKFLWGFRSQTSLKLIPKNREKRSVKVYIASIIVQEGYVPHFEILYKEEWALIRWFY